MDHEDGMIRDTPAVVLLKDVYDYWPQGKAFLPTSTILVTLATRHPDQWGGESGFGRAITAQRLGRMLATSYRVNSTRLDRNGPRGYTRASMATAWRRMGIEAPAPVNLRSAIETGASGAVGETDALREDCEPLSRMPDGQFEGMSCRVCQQPLDSALASFGETTHPTCHDGVRHAS